MIAQIQVDHLRLLVQGLEVGLEVGVGEAPRPAVQQHNRGAVAHPPALGYQRGPADIEPEPRAVHANIDRPSTSPSLH